MPFTKGQPEELFHLRNRAYGWGKVVSRRAYGEEGPGLDLDFDVIASVAVEMGQAVLRGAIEEALNTPWNLLGHHQPCPECARACRRDLFPSPLELAARLAQLLSGDPGENRPRCGPKHFLRRRRGSARRCGRSRRQRSASGAERPRGRRAPATRSGSASRGVGLPIATEKKTTIFRGKPFSRTMVIEKPQDLRVRPRDFAGP